ncbi:hypothetical protein Enr10x_19750 [Gimesia panareensis]|uniref:Uncharacterized protein n=1 Tax=Gimesia panareensis TaxID=2527978 RepID=A0A517Q4W1_9PLAN|nr:DUF5009 domain-containing protein [Gimesia panareensis]QDT26665.1 hypothetical protein Enr10x_19750 [Gimesia panareensis]
MSQNTPNSDAPQPETIPLQKEPETPPPDPQAVPPATVAAKKQEQGKQPPVSQRLTSLDAYRGFVMLAMASGGLYIANALRNSPEILEQYNGTQWESSWKYLWQTLSYQLSHVEWTGAGFWDLIQPSFMFMVGVSMPFSVRKRKQKGDSTLRIWGHAIFRAVLLVALGVFLSSRSGPHTNFTFANVLCQIGLGYLVVFFYVNRSFVTQLIGVVTILGGYWFFFYQYMPAEEELTAVKKYLTEVKHKDEAEWSQFSGFGEPWNKHTNAAAAVDRQFLNQFPRYEEPYEGQKFWVNGGGYQTLNFIPSIATMLFGLMAGQLLMSNRLEKMKVKWLLQAGLICFVVSMLLDTSIWPVNIEQWEWHLVPIVKRIWSPGWAIFSAGWAFWFLAVFYWIIDVKGYKKWAFPFVVVGMNSIAMYCMAQLIRPWVQKSLQMHLTTVDEMTGWSVAGSLFSSDCPYAPIAVSATVLFVLWLICLWMYLQKIFIKI